MDPCRCGTCCEQFLIGVTLEDALREPRIAESGFPVHEQEFIDGEWTLTDEVIAYILNSGADRGTPCVFLSRDAEGRGVCGVYETRPDVCRTFDCQGAGRERLITLGWIERPEASGAG